MKDSAQLKPNPLTNEVVDPFIGGEGVVTALVGKDPQTRSHRTLDTSSLYITTVIASMRSWHNIYGKTSRQARECA